MEQHIGPRDEKKQKMDACFKLISLLGGVIANNSHLGKCTEAFKSKCRADMREYIGKTISGTNHEVSEEMIEIMFDRAEFSGYCHPII